MTSVIVRAALVLAGCAKQMLCYPENLVKSDITAVCMEARRLLRKQGKLD